MGKAWNTSDFPTPAEDSQKHRFSIQKQIARLLMLIEAIKPENSTRQFFNTRLRDLHARSLCASSSDMQGEMWLVFKGWRHRNLSHGSSSQTLFSAEISDSRKYVCVRRLWLRALVYMDLHQCVTHEQHLTILIIHFVIRKFTWTICWCFQRGDIPVLQVSLLNLNISCALKTFKVECSLIPYPWSTSQLILDQHLDWYLLETQHFWV